MKKRPILFSGPMVRAILEGRKTQTRRVMKPQPETYEESWTGDCFHIHFANGKVTSDSGGGERATRHLFAEKHCRYGAPGDKLWVRETWCHKADDDGREVYNSEGNFDPSCFHYYADGTTVMSMDADGSYEFNKDGSEKSPWKPSIHMPRWASRITLDVKSVRVERLQDISEEDAMAEGIQIAPQFCGIGFDGHPVESSRIDWAPTDYFEELWESINGTGSWEQNPWVWVIEFSKEGKGDE
jgi:hypothetical protein